MLGEGGGLIIFHVKGPVPEAVRETESHAKDPTVIVPVAAGRTVTGFVVLEVQPYLSVTVNVEV